MPYDRAMLDARFSYLYFCQSLYTLLRGLPAIAGLLVLVALGQLAGSAPLFNIRAVVLSLRDIHSKP